jgi:hypothetical protein
VLPYDPELEFKHECKVCRADTLSAIERCCPERVKECRAGCAHLYVMRGMGVAVCRLCGDATSNGKIGC